MRNDLIPEMEEFNAMSKAEQIETLCAVHECSERTTKLHRAQYVKRKWNPHPPEQFVKWWADTGWLQTEQATQRGWESVPAVVAFNCEDVRAVYRQHKTDGTLFDRPKAILDADAVRTVEERARTAKQLIAKIAKPMPKYDEPQTLSRFRDRVKDADETDEPIEF